MENKMIPQVYEPQPSQGQGHPTFPQPQPQQPAQPQQPTINLEDVKLGYMKTYRELNDKEQQIISNSPMERDPNGVKELKSVNDIMNDADYLKSHLADIRNMATTTFQVKEREILEWEKECRIEAYKPFTNLEQ